MCPDRTEAVLTGLVIGLAGVLALLMLGLVVLTFEAAGWRWAAGLAALGTVTISGLLWMVLSGDFGGHSGDSTDCPYHRHRPPENRL